MSTVSAQVSVYPLRRPSIGACIQRVQHVLESYDLDVTAGSMSTVVVGTASEVFSALEASFRAACGDGDAVMVVTVSDACPLDTETERAVPKTRSGRHDTAEVTDV